MITSRLFKLPAARVFTADKLIDSRLLNLAGIQVLRQVAARVLLASRRLLRPASRRIEGNRALAAEGLLVLSDFLPPEQFQQLRAECLAALDDADVAKSDLQHGPTIVRRIHLRLHGNRLPIAEAVTSSPRLMALLGAAEAKDLQPSQLHRVVERVIHGRVDQHDPENDLHVDTFHSTHKAWLYLDDVTLDQGPLAVVPRSHRIDGSVLARAYRYFLDLPRAGNSASRRIAASEMQARGLGEIAMAVPANTLVVANTAGYHRRLRGLDGATRTALHVSARSQPFLFWVNASGKADYT